MMFPFRLSMSLAAYVAGQRLQGHRSPTALMLEPTLACNLNCAGCGRIREHSRLKGRMLDAEESLASVRESGVPVVCVSGGEPLLHPEIPEIVEGILAEGRFIYFCTNGIRLEESLDLFRPDPNLSFVVHLDGLAPTHERITGREGLFQEVVAAIVAAKRRGFKVLTNTTLFKDTDPEEAVALFRMLDRLGTDGAMLAPAYSYEEVEAGIFMTRDEVIEYFQPIYDRRDEYQLYNTPFYVEFLAGRRDLHCSPWSTVTRDPRGWKRPCYLLGDSFCDSFEELIETTDWDRYGPGRDPRCAHCMLHSGFEASGLEGLVRSPRDLYKMARWNFTGKS